MLKELIAEINRKRFEQYLFGFTFKIEAAFRNVISWPLTLFHIIGIALSIPLIVLNIDWQYFVFFKQNPMLQILLFPAVSIGGLVPLIIPPIIYLHGKRENIPQLIPLAYALTQAAVVGVFWASLYKALTGRTGPELFEDHDGNYSQEFSFGFLRQGVFDGWPSAHTTIAWALAIVFYYYRPQIQTDGNRPIKKELPKFIEKRSIGIYYAVYVSIGVSTNIHWLSDVVAGVFIGITVGVAVCKNFDINWGHYDHMPNKRNKIYFVFLVIFVLILFSIIGLDDYTG